MPKSATWPDECGRGTPEGPDVPGELGMTCPREEDVTGSSRLAAHPGQTGTRVLVGGVNGPIFLKHSSFPLSVYFCTILPATH